MALDAAPRRLNRRYLAFQYFCISRNRNDAVQVIITRPVNACQEAAVEVATERAPAFGVNQLQLSQLGQVHHAVVLTDSTALIGGSGTQQAVATRVAHIRAQIDPTKVVSIALENAVSVASILLLTEATMTDIQEKPAPLMQPPIPE